MTANDQNNEKFTPEMTRELCARADLYVRELAGMIAEKTGVDVNVLAQSLQSHIRHSSAIDSATEDWLWFFHSSIKSLPEKTFTYQQIFDKQTGLLATRGLSVQELATLCTAQLRNMGYADEITQASLSSYQSGKVGIPKRLQVALALVAEKLPALPDKTFTWQQIFDDKTGLLTTRGLSVQELATLCTAQLRQMGYADEITRGGLTAYQNGKWGIPKRVQSALALVAEKLPALPDKTFTGQRIFDKQTGLLATRGLSSVKELATLCTAQLRQMGYADDITRGSLNRYQNGKNGIPKRLKVALFRIDQFLAVMGTQDFLNLLGEFHEHQALALWPKPAPALTLPNFTPLMIHGKMARARV